MAVVAAHAVLLGLHVGGHGDAPRLASARSTNATRTGITFQYLLKGNRGTQPYNPAAARSIHDGLAPNNHRMHVTP